MKKRILSAVALGGTVIALAGCGGGSRITSGTVIGKSYEARVWNECKDFVKVCYGGWDGARWMIEIRNGDSTAWYSVGRGTFHHLRLGQEITFG